MSRIYLIYINEDLKSVIVWYR